MSTRARTRLRERLRPEIAIPLLAAYFSLSALYAWQAWRREMPTIFTDELEFTQVSRGIAEGVRPTRRGEPVGLPTLYAFVAAPAWWLSGTAAAFAAIKYAGVLLMTATIFPAYALSRYVCTPPYALFAAIAAAGAPALAYAPFLVEEPLAYPAATLALLAIVRTTARPRVLAIGLALAACLFAYLVRGQLIVLAVVLAASLLAVAWRSERVRRLRAQWTIWDRIGLGALVVGAALAVSAELGHRSESWYVATSFYKGRMLEYGLWAAGALAVGIGIFPFVAGLAGLVRPRRETLDARARAFVVVAASALAVFGLYAAVKAAYLSTVYGTLVVERNLIYLVPVLAAGTALVLERRGARWWAVAAAGGLTVYLVSTTPTKLDLHPYYEAHGLAILALANREWSWSAETIETALIWIALVSTAIVAILRLVPRAGVAARACLIALCASVLTWSLAAEVYAASGERDFSHRFAQNLTRPYDWVDRATGGASVTYLGQQIADPTGIELTEFWNRSIHNVWSLDGSVAGTGPTISPDLARADGTLAPNPGTAFALTSSGVELQAPVIRQIGTTFLYRLDGGPMRLRFAQSGVFSDGWMSDRSAYTRFDARGQGFAKVILSRTAWCGKNVPGRVTIRIGPVAIREKQPAIGRGASVTRTVINACESKPLLLRAPPGPWRVEVEISPTFVPRELDAANSDLRRLGAQIAFDFVPLS